MKKTVLGIIKNLLILLILLFSFALVFTINWAYDTFGNLTLEEIVFNLKVPLQGTNKDFFVDYIKNVLPYILGLTIGTFIILSIIFKKKKIKPKKAKRMKEKTTSLVIYKKFKINFRYLLKLTTCIIILVCSVFYCSHKTNLVEYVQFQLSNSNLIEDEYVDPRNTNITAPENKRNLIYIYLESMEATYFSKANGGAYEQSIIPEIEQLAVDNIAFSNSDTLKGSYSLPGTTWTSGAMVAQTVALPLKIAVDGNNYGSYTSFLPGAYGIGEILQNQGYNQYLMVGSDAAFGGRSNLYRQHGAFEIFEVNTAIYENKMTEEDKVWWGFEDSKLFEYAKEKITLLAEQDKPFNFTMLTADTHHPNGYYCEKCENKFAEKYFNVLACSSKQVAEFVNWIQQQDFYENTTIVIAGDHLSMQKNTFDPIEQNGYDRTTVNIFINSVQNPVNTKNRGNSTLDMFPSTLASMGYTIEGNRLGIGTNLFSDRETIVTKYGIDKVTEELSKNSRFYNKQFLYE